MLQKDALAYRLQTPHTASTQNREVPFFRLQKIRDYSVFEYRVLQSDIPYY